MLKIIASTLAIWSCLSAAPQADTTGCIATDTQLGQTALEETPAKRTSSAKLEGKLNVNEASEDQWVMLPGIGPSTAAKIMAYRAKQKFGDTTHLMRIKGIGRKTYNNLKPFLTMDGPTTLRKL